VFLLLLLSAVAHDFVLGNARLLPLLRLLHPAGQHPEVVGVHVLAISTSCSSTSTGRGKRQEQVRRVGGRKQRLGRRHVLEDRGRRAQGQRHRRGHEVGERWGHDRLLPAVQVMSWAGLVTRQDRRAKKTTL
jgi:hypothetical protein